MSEKQKIVVLADWFAPGYKAGGPIRSCVNFVMEMRTEYDIRVITTDRDHSASQPYGGLPADAWTGFSEGVEVWYFSKNGLRFARLRALLREVDPDFIYLNSMFSLPFTLWPLWMKARGQLKAQLILAPRGMLHASALQYKSLKKRLFLRLLRASGWSRFIRFQATHAQEVLNIRRQIDPAAEIVEVANFPVNCAQPPGPLTKAPGELRMVFISRISPVKNLDFLLAVLSRVQARVVLDVYGPIEAQDYWETCRRQIGQLPEQIEVNYCGEREYHEVNPTLARYHLFCLPTHGENFGHAIFEALAAGRPVLISDRTPWRNLAAQQAGWDIPLSAPEAYATTLEHIARMDQQTWNAWAQGAWSYAKAYVRDAGLKEKYRQLFS